MADQNQNAAAETAPADTSEETATARAMALMPDQASKTDPPSTKTAETVPPSTKTDPSTVKTDLAPKAAQFAAMARAERAARAEKEAAKQALAELKQVQEQSARFQSIRDPVAFAKEAEQILGQSWFEQLLSVVERGGQPTPDMTAQLVRRELETFKQEQAAEAKRRGEEQAKLVEEQNQRYLKGAVDFVKANAEKYDLISLNEAHDLVESVIVQNFQQTGKSMTFEEAADATEKFLEEQVIKNMASKKIQARAAPRKPSEGEAGEQGQRQASRTLSNSMTAETPPTSNGSAGDDEDEAWRRASALWPN